MPDSPAIRLATRGSALALAQAALVQAQCQAAFPDQTFELRVIKTTGDKLQSASLAGAELPKGLFTKELEEALLRNDADLAVHSLKDLPTELPPGLKLGAVPTRADVRDVLLYRDLDYQMRHVNPKNPVRQNRRSYRPALSVRALPHRAVVGTSSTRRAAQLLEHRPDLQIIPMRGNVGTRLRKLAEQAELDATVLAAAGLARLQIQLEPAGALTGPDLPAGLAATSLSLDEMLPCVGQGALGIEVRAHDARVAPICAALNHAPSHACVFAERAFLQAWGGGCHLAVAAYAEVRGEQLHLRGLSFLTPQARRGQIAGGIEQATELGHELAKSMRD